MQQWLRRAAHLKDFAEFFLGKDFKSIIVKPSNSLNTYNNYCIFKYLFTLVRFVLRFVSVQHLLVHFAWHLVASCFSCLENKKQLDNKILGETLLKNQGLELDLFFDSLTLSTFLTWWDNVLPNPCPINKGSCDHCPNLWLSENQSDCKTEHHPSLVQVMSRTNSSFSAKVVLSV